MNVVRLQALDRATPPSSWLCQLWSRKEDLQRAWYWDRKAVWDQVGLSHCPHEGLVTVWDEACLRRGHNDQSRRGHQCSETMLTGESWFHISTPLGLNPGTLWREANGSTTGPVERCMNAVRLQALYKYLIPILQIPDKWPLRLKKYHFKDKNYSLFGTESHIHHKWIFLTILRIIFCKNERRTTLFNFFSKLRLYQFFHPRC